MKKIILLILFNYITGYNVSMGSIVGFDYKNIGWKAGVARVVITPEEPIWMGGFAFRDRPSDGKLHDLWAKSLALEDENGQLAVLVTMDLVGIPKNLSNNIRNRVGSKYGLSKSQIILNSSHTHSSPAIHYSLGDIYPMDTSQRERVDEYSKKLENKIVELIGKSLQSMESVKLQAENGFVHFQMNRRSNSASNQTEVNGPSDYSVPVLKIENNIGELLAIVFGYACHPVSVRGYKLSGDYVGFAQMELEKTFPGVTALFFQGAGADQNPAPLIGNTAAWAKQHGKSLAAAVQRVINEDMRELPSKLSTAYSEVDLPLTSAPGIEELSEFAEGTEGYQKRWALRLIDKLQRGKELRSSYPYPIQIWQLGDQPIVSLGGELVVDYAIEIKRIFGQHTFVMGYSNDVMGYIPSTRVLREGGYEGASSQIAYGLPSPWSASIETLIFHEILKLAKQANIPIPN